MNTSLEQKAADLEANGWKITWNEEEKTFRAVNRFLTCPVYVFSVLNDMLVREEE